MADFFNTQLSHTTLDDFYGRPMLVFRSTPEESWQALAKEILDVGGAFVLASSDQPGLPGGGARHPADARPGRFSFGSSAAA